MLDLVRTHHAELVDQEPEPAPRRLWRITAFKDVDGQHPLYVQVRCSSTARWYFLRVDPTAYGGVRTCQAAMASLWIRPGGELLFPRPEDYHPDFES